jgi:hypothetical protein
MAKKKLKTVEGPIDTFIDAKVEKQLRKRLSSTQFRLMFEELLAYQGSPFIDLIEPIVGPYIDDMADVFSHAILTLLLDIENEGVGASGEPEVRRLMRARIHRNAIKPTMEKHPDWTRKQAREAVKAEITDERIIEAAKQAAAQQGMQAPVDAGIWDWILANWPAILNVLMSLLMVFIL